jgi:hypothetical protein
MIWLSTLSNDGKKALEGVQFPNLDQIANITGKIKSSISMKQAEWKHWKLEQQKFQKGESM